MHRARLNRARTSFCYALSRAYNRATDMRDEPFLPRRRSVRLPFFDYSRPGAYFLTICLRDKKQLFGKVAAHAIELSTLGRIAEECWLEIPAHFPVVRLGPHVIMPDHVHGIVIIQSPTNADAGAAASGGNPAKDHRRARYIVPLREKPLREFAESIAGSVATIVATFKAAVARQAARELSGTKSGMLWQRGYYEHVIRNEQDFQNACEYIRMNPARRAFELEYWQKHSNGR